MAVSLLSASVIDEVQKSAKLRLQEMYSDLQQALLQDGRPPLHQERSERALYEALAGMRARNDPRFWTSPEAAKDWERLQKKFGPAPERLMP